MTIGVRKLITVDIAVEQEQQEVATEALALPDQARAHKVEDSDTLAVANNFFTMCHQMEKKIDATFDPLCKATNAAHKAATKAKADAKAPVTEAKSIVRSEIESYNDIQRDIRAAIERAAQEEAQRKAESEHIAKAASLEAQGHRELAAQVLDSPVVVHVVAVPTVKEEVKGAPFVEVWHAEVLDMNALLRAILSGVAPMDAIEPNEKIINNLAKMKGAVQWPGVRVWSTQDLRASGR